MTFLVEQGDKPLSALKEEVRLRTTATTTGVETFHIDTVEGCFGFKTAKGKDVEVPLNERGLTVLSDFLDVPYKFVERQDPDFQNVILNGLLDRARVGEVVIRHSKGGIGGIYKPTQTIIDPGDVVGAAIDVMGGQSPVIHERISPRYFTFDVVAHESMPESRLGDRKVGDLTRAGLRFGLDIQHNHAPWVQPYANRLVCTNGMEMTDGGLKVTIVGHTVEEVIRSLEENARIAFNSVERKVEAFYAMRDDKVADPQGRIQRMALEAGLSDRVTNRLVERVSEIEGEVSLFDLTNIITNEANRDGTKPDVARSLQRLGGQAIVDHAARCAHCSARLLN